MYVLMVPTLSSFTNRLLFASARSRESVSLRGAPTKAHSTVPYGGRVRFTLSGRILRLELRGLWWRRDSDGTRGARFGV